MRPGAAIEPEAKRPLLEVKDLRTQFFTQDGVVKAVNGVSFACREQEPPLVEAEPGHVVACHFWDRIRDQFHASVAARDIVRVVTAPVPSPRASVAVAG